VTWRCGSSWSLCSDVPCSQFHPRHISEMQKLNPSTIPQKLFLLQCICRAVQTGTILQCTETNRANGIGRLKPCQVEKCWVRKNAAGPIPSLCIFPCRAWSIRETAACTNTYLWDWGVAPLKGWSEVFHFVHVGASNWWNNGFGKWHLHILATKWFDSEVTGKELFGLKNREIHGK